jgi:hypothetical protein
MASLMMLLCSALLAWLASPLAWALATACMAAVATWLWRRPEPAALAGASAIDPRDDPQGRAR